MTDRPRGSLAFAVPGDAARLSGGSAYDRRVIEAWRRKGVVVQVLHWGEGFPSPSRAERREAAADLARLPAGSTVLVDGLAFGALPALAAEQAARLHLCALVHHPLALETGADPDRRRRQQADETRALASAAVVIATSRATAERLAAAFGVPRRRLHVAVPGLELPEPARRPRESRGGSGLILSVGAPSPRKGFEVLLPAVAALPPGWRWQIVGSLDHHPVAVERLRAGITHLDLDGRVILSGSLSDSELRRAFAAADIFVCPSHHEGYGMAIAEALACGLPVLATTGCAIVHELPPGAVLLAEPGDAAGAARQLARLAADPALRARLGDAGAAAAARLPTWEETAARLMRVLSASGRRWVSRHSARTGSSLERIVL